MSADEPVTVATGTGERLHAIPAVPASVPTAGQTGPLDEVRLRRIRSETEQVGAVLADVFAEDEPASQTAAAPDTEDTGLPGLQGAHAQLVRLLATNGTWSRADYEAAATSCGLLPDGALEAVNEWAFDHFDEPLVEEGDPMIVNTALLAAAADVSDAA